MPYAFSPARLCGSAGEGQFTRFVDTDGDGRADQVTNFYEGGTATMNLAVYEDGSVFVATRMRCVIVCGTATATA